MKLKSLLFWTALVFVFALLPVRAFPAGEQEKADPGAVPELPPLNHPALDDDAGGLLPPILENTNSLVGKDKKINLAVVRDGNSYYIDALYADLKKELQTLAEGDFEPVFQDGNDFNAQWDVKRVDQVLAKALRSSSVDIVLAIGPMVSQAAASWPRELQKPVVVGFTMPAQSLGFKVDEKGHFDKKNLSGVFVPDRVPGDLKNIKRLFEFDRLYFLADERLMKRWEGLSGSLARRFQEAGIGDVKVKPMGDKAAETLASLGEDVRVVYLSPPIRMSEEEQQKLFDGLMERKILTYSMVGDSEIRRGILSGSLPAIQERQARRIALNVQAVALGELPGQAPTDLDVSERLMVNAQTARKVGYWPDFDVALNIRYVNLDLEQKGHPLCLGQASIWAAQQNLDVVIQQAKTEGSLQDTYKARSTLFPQVTANTQYLQIDEDRADASAGNTPEMATTVGLTVTQVLFNDEVISRFRAAGRAYEGTVFEEMALKLDLMAEGANRFLDFLMASVSFRIEADNLSLVEKNLELARARVQVGISGREEVLRLEASEAQRRSTLYAAESKLQQARVALNQTLNADLKTRWMPRDVTPDDPDQFYLYVSLEKYLKNMVGLEMLTQFMILEALDNSPTLQSLHKAVEAQEIILAYLKRKFVVPELAAQFDYSHQAEERYGKIPAVYSAMGLTGADRDDWSVALIMTLPLFQGGGRVYDVAKAKADLAGLIGKRDKIIQLLEQRVRNSIFRLMNSGPNITLSREAADKAAQNLEIVQDKYARGTAGLVDLLDAQNEAQVQDLAAALAMYTFLKDYVEAQRAACWFEFGRPKRDIEAYVCRFKTFVEMNQQHFNPLPGQRPTR